MSRLLATSRIVRLGLVAASVLSAVPVRAAGINFTSPTNISADTDVSTIGAQLYGFDWNNAAASVNGVSFTGTTTSAGTITGSGGTVTVAGENSWYNGGGTSAMSSQSSLSSSYKTLLGGVDYGATTATVTLNSLTSNHTYLLQYWVNDSRGVTNTDVLSSSGGNSQTLKYDVSGAAGGTGQFVNGYFTTGASATTQQFTIAGTNSYMNALQVRDVTNIGYWNGLNSATWDASTTANFCTNLYSAALATGTTSQVAALVPNVYFADSYYNAGATTSVTQNSITVATGGVSIGNVNFINSSVTYTLASADANGISGTSAVFVSGGGTVNLAGANTYTGGTNLSAGTLNINHAAALGATASVFTIAGGTIDNTSGAAIMLANNNPLKWNGDFTFTGASDGSHDLNLGSGAVTLGSSRTVTVNAGNLTVGGAISGSGFSLTKAGAGTLTLTATPSYSGGTMVSAGTMAFTNTNYGGIITNNATVNITQSIVDSSSTIQLLGTGVYNLSAASGHILRLQSNVSDVGGQINVLGGGTVRNDSLTANWSANAAGMNVASGATFALRGNDVRIDALTGAGDVGNDYQPSTKTLTVGVNNGSGTFSGAIHGSSANLADGNIDNGILNLNKTGSGTQILSGTNTYIGSTTIAGGTLSVGANGNLGAASNSINFNGGILQVTGTSLTSLTGHTVNWSTFNGGFDINNAANTFTVSSNIGGSGAFTKLGAGVLLLTGTGNTFNGATISAGTLQIGDGATSNGSLPGNVSNSGTLAFGTFSSQVYAGAISGGGGVTKSGAASLTLSGANGYTGATTINAGTLRITGSLANTAVTVNSTGNLAGAGNGTTTGVINGNVSLNGGAINLVDGAPGALTLTNGLSIGAASALDFEAGASGTDLLAVTGGSVSITAPTTVNITALGSLSTGAYNLLTFGSGMASGLNNLSLSSSVIAGRNVSLQTTSTSEQLVVTGATAYWTGSLGAGQAAWNAGSGTSTNWTADAGGTTGVAQPTSTVDVYFTATGAANLSTTLGANFDISSLHFNANATSSVTITDSTFSLTIEGGGIAVDSGSGAHTIGVNGVVVNASQGWFNNSSNLFTVSSGVTGTATMGNTTTLTLSGSGTGGILLSGPIGDGAGGGNLALVVSAASGVVTLSSAANTYSGGTTIAGGTLRIGVSNALPTGTSLTFGSASSNGTLDLAGLNQQISGLAVAAAVPGGNVASQVIGSSGPMGSTSTLTYNGGTSSFGGTIQDVLGTYNGQNVALAVAGGSLTLSGPNTYSGGTSVAAGTLRAGASNTLPIGTTVTFGAAATNGTLDLGGFNQQVAGLAVAGTVPGGSIVNQTIGSSGGSGTTSTLTFSGGTSSFAGTIKDVIGTNNGQKVAIAVSAGSLTLSGTGITYSGGSTVSGGSLRIVDATGLTAGPLTVNTPGILEISSSQSFANRWHDGGTLSGSGTLNKTGNGYFLLTGTNNFAGQINVQAGTLGNDSLTANWSGSTANMDISSGATLDLRGNQIIVNALTDSGSVTNSNATAQNIEIGVANGSGLFSGMIADGAGQVGVVKAGSGTETLTGTNGYTGVTQIVGGTLSIPALSAINGSSSAYLAIQTGGTFQYTGTGTETRAGVLYWNSGAATINISQPMASLILTATGGTRNQVFTKSGPGALTVNGEIDNTVTVTGGTMTINGLVTAGTMQASGGGTLYLTGSAPNTYTVDTFALGGTVSVSSLTFLNNAQSADSSYLAIQSGGTFQYTGAGTESSTKFLYWNSGAATVDIPSATAVLNWTPSGGVRNQTFTKTGAGKLSVTGAVSGNTTVSGGTLEYIDSGYTGAMTNNATVNLTQSTADSNGGFQLLGSGIYNLTAIGSSRRLRLTSTVADLGGQINILGAGAVENDALTANWSANTAGMNVASGATFDLRGNNVNIDAVTGSGSIINSFWQANSGIRGEVLTVGVNGGSGSFDGAITGTGATPTAPGEISLVKQGAGTQILTGANTYAGTTTISAGTLQIGAGGPDGAIGTGTVIDNAALVFDINASGMDITAPINGTGTVTQNGTGVTTLSATNGYSGATTINAGELAIDGSLNSLSTITVNDTGTLGGIGTVGGSVILTGGATGAAISSSGTLTIGGTLTVNGLNNSITSGTIVNTTGDVINGSLAVDGTLGGTGFTVLSNGATLAGFGLVNKPVTAAGNNTMMNTVMDIGSLSLGSTLSISGTGNVIPSGSTINVASLTTINGGASLTVAGTLGGAGTTTVNGTLSGTGAVNQAVTVASGGAINGSSGATLTLGSLSLSQGSLSNFNLTAAGANNSPAALMAITGGLTGPNSIAGHTINFTGHAALGIYDLYSFTGTPPQLSDFIKGTVPPEAFNYTLSVDSMHDQIDLNVTTIGPPLGSGTWTNGAGGQTWTNANNWMTGQPSGATYVATFDATGYTATNPNPVLLGMAGQIVGGLVFNTAAGTGYAIGGGGSDGPLTLNNNGNSAATITVNGGDQIIAANVVVAETTGATLSAVSGASLSITGMVTNGGYPLSVSGAGNTTLSGALSGSGSLTMSGTGMLTLGHSNSGYSGLTTVSSGTLRTGANVDNALGTGPLVANSTVNLNGNENIGTLSGSGNVSVAANKTLAVAPTADQSLAGLTLNAAAGPSTPSLSLSGSHVLTLNGAATLNTGSIVSVGDGTNTATLRMNLTSNATVGTGVSAIVAAGATLELDGTNSALQDGMTSLNRASVTNSGTLAVGNSSAMVPVTGAQQVGGIDGSGSVVVADNSGLTADHINQTSLVIGSGSTFTLAPSDEFGNPMVGAVGSGQSAGNGLVLAASLAPSSSFIAATGNLLNAGGSVSSFSEPSLGGIGGASASAVPEPASVVLLGLGMLGLFSVGLAKRRRSAR